MTRSTISSCERAIEISRNGHCGTTSEDSKQQPARNDIDGLLLKVSETGTDAQEVHVLYCIMVYGEIGYLVWNPCACFAEQKNTVRKWILWGALCTFMNEAPDEYFVPFADEQDKSVNHAIICGLWQLWQKINEAGRFTCRHQRTCIMPTEPI